MRDLYGKLTRWINQVPWVPDDVKITVKQNVTSITAKNQVKGAKYDKKLYDMINHYISGARFFAMWLDKRKKK